MRWRRELEQQRYDDHRFYHHSRTNQSLHLYSAISFLVAYFMAFQEPWLASLVAWHGMIPRQIGHFFFEPKSYDYHNQISHRKKESIKIGYNLERKKWMLSICFLIPLLGYIDPAVTDFNSFSQFAGYALLVIAVGAILARSAYLGLYKGEAKTALIWVLKIATDPIHDIKLYWKSPYYILIGDYYDPGYSSYELKYAGRTLKEDNVSTC